MELHIIRLDYGNTAPDTIMYYHLFILEQIQYVYHMTMRFVKPVLLDIDVFVPITNSKIIPSI